MDEELKKRALVGECNEFSWWLIEYGWGWNEEEEEEEWLKFMWDPAEREEARWWNPMAKIKTYSYDPMAKE